MNIEIKAIQIREHYELVAELMKGLHDSEQEFFNKAATWNNIREGYMRHIITCQEEYDGTFLLAMDGAKPAGFMYAYTEEQDDSRIDVYLGTQLYVSDGFILPEYRRQGIYQKLNRAMEDIYIAKGIRRITRFTLSSNKRMQQLLEKEGYKPTRYYYEKWLREDGKEIDELELRPQKD